MRNRAGIAAAFTAAGALAGWAVSYTRPEFYIADITVQVADVRKFNEAAQQAISDWKIPGGVWIRARGLDEYSVSAGGSTRAAAADAVRKLTAALPVRTATVPHV